MPRGPGTPRRRERDCASSPLFERSKPEHALSPSWWHPPRRRPDHGDGRRRRSSNTSASAGRSCAAASVPRQSFSEDFAIIRPSTSSATRQDASAMNTARSRRSHVTRAANPAWRSQPNWSATPLGLSYSGLRGVTTSPGSSGMTTSARTNRPPRVTRAATRRNKSAFCAASRWTYRKCRDHNIE
jgi:hypothetical protein